MNLTFHLSRGRKEVVIPTDFLGSCLTMRKYSFSRFLFASLVLFFVSGCGTIQGLKRDAQFAVKTIEDALFTQGKGGVSTPSAYCEPIYKKEELSSSYRVCLGERVEASLSSDALDYLYYGKAFPKCQKIYKDPKADWQGYRKCQGDEWVRTEVNRLVQWRKDLDRRIVATEKASMGRRK